MYYQHIIKRPEDELIHKFYKAQKLSPSKGDWVTLIEKDKNLLDIEMEDEDIARLSKYVFKKYVKKATREKAYKFLIDKKEKHFKLNDITYKQLEMQNYLKNNNNLIDEKNAHFSDSE